MSLAQDGYAFGSPTWHSGALTGPRMPEIRSFKWAGLAGESHLTGPPGGRDLAVECLWQAASETALVALRDALDAQVCRLFGDVSIQPTAREAITYAQCTFLGGELSPPQEDPHLGWHALGVLRWRQRVAPVPGGA